MKEDGGADGAEVQMVLGCMVVIAQAYAWAMMIVQMVLGCMGGCMMKSSWQRLDTQPPLCCQPWQCVCINNRDAIEHLD